MTYEETKNKLDELRKESEILFRMALSHLIDVGTRHLTEEAIEETCKVIMEQDDSFSLLTNDYQCQLIRTAGEIAKVDHMHLLMYIQKEVNYDIEFGEGWWGDMLILKGENGKSKAIEAILDHTNSVCFIYHDKQIQLNGIYIDSNKYSVKQLEDYVAIYLQNATEFYDYVIIYTNVPEEDICDFQWLGWISANTIITCI